jgi:uncharacterized membrane protein HdeD (DUF308 family)
MAPRWSSQPAGADVGSSGFEPNTFLGGLARNDIRRARTWLIVAAVLALIAGAVAIAVPIVASVTTAIFIGWLLLAAGITMAIHAVTQRSLPRGLEAVLSFGAGLYLLVSPLSGTVTLTFVLAVWFFASGVLSLSVAAQWRGLPGASMHAVGGALSIVLGFLIAASLPSSAAWAIGLLVGVNLIFWGVRALIGARLLKELASG